MENSPLKESDHIDISGSIFKWKYPLWYCNHINVETVPYLKLLDQVFGILIILVLKIA